MVVMVASGRVGWTGRERPGARVRTDTFRDAGMCTHGSGLGTRGVSKKFVSAPAPVSRRLRAQHARTAEEIRVGADTNFFDTPRGLRV
jgi:hypothetical protein